MTKINNTPGSSEPGDGDTVAPTQTAGLRSSASTAPPNHVDANDVSAPPLGNTSAMDDEARHRAGSQRCISSESEPAPHRVRRKSIGLVDSTARHPGATTVPFQDPAITVGLAIRLGRMARRHCASLPGPVARSLRSAVADGDAAASLVENWARQIGVIDADDNADIGNESEHTTMWTGGGHD